MRPLRPAGLLLAWLGGRLIADGVIRFVGFKRGPKMLVTLLGGILIGAAVAFVGEALVLAGRFGADAALFIAASVFQRGLWAGLAAVIACFGAWSRMRL